MRSVADPHGSPACISLYRPRSRSSCSGATTLAAMMLSGTSGMRTGARKKPSTAPCMMSVRSARSYVAMFLPLIRAAMRNASSLIRRRSEVSIHEPTSSTRHVTTPRCASCRHRAIVQSNAPVAVSCLTSISNLSIPASICVRSCSQKSRQPRDFCTSNG